MEQTELIDLYADCVPSSTCLSQAMDEFQSVIVNNCMKETCSDIDFGRRRLRTSSVEVTWSWTNESEGTINWQFYNPTSSQLTVLLLRNGYYFGNAYWPIYYQNWPTTFPFITSITPLSVEGTYPLGITQFSNGDMIASFLFTLSPGQTWNATETGFSSSTPPQYTAAPVVTYIETETLCMTYDEAQVTQYDSQTQTSYSAYSPNPKEIESVIMNAGSALYVSRYPNNFTTTHCPIRPRTSSSTTSGSTLTTTNAVDASHSSYSSNIGIIIGGVIGGAVLIVLIGIGGFLLYKRRIRRLIFYENQRKNTVSYVEPGELDVIHTPSSVLSNAVNAPSNENNASAATYPFPSRPERKRIFRSPLGQTNPQFASSPQILSSNLKY